MKFVIQNKHREFFDSQGWMTLGEVLPPSRVEELRSNMLTLLAKRLAVSQEHLQRLPIDRLFSHSRDLWRDSSALQKLVVHRELANVMAELCDKRPLRLAFTQLLWTPSPENLFTASVKPWIDEEAALESHCSIQGIEGAILLALQETEPSADLPADELEGPKFPLRLDDTLFLGPSLPWVLPAVKPSKLYCLIGYASAQARYHIEPRDPFTHQFRRQGYGTGDRLKDAFHPIVCR